MRRPAGAHDLRQGAGIVAIGLVALRLHRGMRMSRFDDDRRMTGRRQLGLQPKAQRGRLKADPLQLARCAFERAMNGLRIGRNADFRQAFAMLVDDADMGFFQRDIQPSIGGDFAFHRFRLLSLRCWLEAHCV